MIKESFRKYLEEAIGGENALVAFSAFGEEPSVSVRVNPFKGGRVPVGAPVVWNAHGVILEQRPCFTLDPLFHAGAYYVQDSSSMFVGHVFRQIVRKMEHKHERPFRVLDLCAAPGGKTTDLAASLREVFGDNFLLVSNEVMKSRVGILADNVAIWGDPNVVVTSDDPSAFMALQGYFDVILADVPCSGEGMFRKDDDAQNQWSEDNVSLCQARQRRIVADVWSALAPGGVFIYSTCTFNRYENDDNVEWIASELGAEVIPDDMTAGLDGIIRTRYGYSLVPGHVKGEGQYCASLIKDDFRAEVFRTCRPRGGRVKLQSLSGVCDGVLLMPAVYSLKGDTVIAVPSSLEEDIRNIREYLHVVATGCAVGTLKGKVFIPGADLALSIVLNARQYPVVEVDEKTALSFLHKDTLILSDAEKGYVVISYLGVPLGFVKNLGSRCNNLHPQSRRIRMNINR